MISPALALHKAVYATLNGALSGVGIYDNVPPKAALPYVTYGDNQIMGDEDRGGDFWRASVEVRVYAKGSTEAATITDQVFAALHRDLDLDPPLTCDMAEVEQCRTWHEGSGVFTGMIVIEYLIQAAD